MNTKIRYAAPEPTRTHHGPWARVFRLLILLGVWVLVGLAGLAAWVRLLG